VTTPRVIAIVPVGAIEGAKSRLGAVLDAEERRANERDLLRHYLSELTARGVEAPNWDDAWRKKRRFGWDCRIISATW